MKIIRLTAENVKRLRAVEFDPDGTVQVVTGRNAQGKSSVLDAIWLALGGGAASRETPRPVRDGEDEARVTLDLGDLIVTRTWDAVKGSTSLRVTAPDGSVYRSPQTLLDQLVGKLSFDPLAFTRLSAREQRAALLDLLDLDFADADRERARLYDERLETGRKAHAFGDLPKLPKGAPMVETSASDLLDDIAEAQRAQAERDTWAHARDSFNDRIARAERAVEVAERALKDARTALGDAITERDQHLDFESFLPEVGDIAKMREHLRDVEAHNAEVRDNRKRVADREAQKALQEHYTDLTHMIEAIDQRKADALAAADMPVEGLGFTDEGVTYRGVPFAQASSAEQIRVSLAMAMALNPSLRVIRILDGSLLDADSMRALTEQAAAHDFQVWVERVEDATATAVVIEDGSVIR